MNTILHKHFFAYVSDELVSELEVPAQTVLINSVHPIGHNVLKTQNFYVYTFADIDNPPKHTLYTNSVYPNRISITLHEPTKLVPIYELQATFNTDHSAYVDLHLQPINVVQKEYYLPHVKDHYSLPGIKELLEPEFFKFFTYATIHVDKLFEEHRAFFRISYSSSEDAEIYYSMVSDMAGFKEAVLKFADKFEPECGLITETGFPYYAVTVPLDFNKVVDYFNIRIVD